MRHRVVLEYVQRRQCQGEARQLEAPKWSPGAAREKSAGVFPFVIGKNCNVAFCIVCFVREMSLDLCTLEDIEDGI